MCLYVNFISEFTEEVDALVALSCESLASETKHVQSTHKLMPQVTTQCILNGGQLQEDPTNHGTSQIGGLELEQK